MDENKNKVKEFVQKHKKAIVVTGVVAACIVHKIVLKKNAKIPTAKNSLDNIDLDKLGLLGRVVQVEEASSGLAWFEGEDALCHTVADLGVLGEKLMTDGVVNWKPDEKISGILIYKQ